MTSLCSMFKSPKGGDKCQALVFAILSLVFIDDCVRSLSTTSIFIKLDLISVFGGKNGKIVYANTTSYQ